MGLARLPSSISNDGIFPLPRSLQRGWDNPEVRAQRNVVLEVQRWRMEMGAYGSEENVKIGGYVILQFYYQSLYIIYIYDIYIYDLYIYI